MALSENLELLGATLQDIQRPGSLAAFELEKQKRKGAQRFERLAQGLPSGGEPLTQPQFSELAILADQGNVGAKTILQSQLQGQRARQITPFQERTVSLAERKQRQTESKVLRSQELFKSLQTGTPKRVQLASNRSRKSNTAEIERLTAEMQQNQALLLDPALKDFGEARIKGNVAQIKRLQDIETKRPTALAAFERTKQNNTRTIKAIKTAIGRVNRGTAGPMGATAPLAFGTPIFDLRTNLETIRSGLGFKELEEMRLASPTGGALGQVSDNENKLLQAVIANLDQRQSPDELRRNLNIVLDQIKQSTQRISAAFAQDFGGDGAQIPTGDVQSDVSLQALTDETKAPQTQARGDQATNLGSQKIRALLEAG